MHAAQIYADIYMCMADVQRLHGTYMCMVSLHGYVVQKINLKQL
jgi:hypothetical protein